MGSFGGKSLKIPEIVMCGLRLRNFCIGFRLSRVDDIRKFDCILNEKDGNVISDEVPIAFSSIEFDCKAADIANSVRRTTRS